MAKLITEEEFEIAVAYLRVLILTSAGKKRRELKPRCLGVISRKPADWEIESELVWDPPRLTINKTANFIWDTGARKSAVYNIDELSSPASDNRGCDAKGSPGPHGWFVYFRVGEGELGEVLVALHKEYGGYETESANKALDASDEMKCRRVVARVLRERGIEVSPGHLEEVEEIVPSEYDTITEEEFETAAQFLRVRRKMVEMCNSGEAWFPYIPFFRGWGDDTVPRQTVRWDGTTLTLYDNRGDIASYDTRQMFPVGGSWHPKEDEVELFSGNGRIKPNACFGVGTFGRVLNLLSEYGVKIMSEDGIAEARIAVRNIIALHGIQVRHGKSPKTRDPRGLPGINFPRVKAHVESTRYKEPAPKTETKLEWGDYTALIEAIERADPKRKRKKPTPPPKPKKVREPKPTKVREPKPKKVREPKPKRRIPWDLVLMLAELLLAGVTCYIVSTQGPDSPWPFLSGFVCIFVALFGLAESTKHDDQDE